jgi:hypothetical protein
MASMTEFAGEKIVADESNWKLRAATPNLGCEDAGYYSSPVVGLAAGPKSDLAPPKALAVYGSFLKQLCRAARSPGVR